MSVLTYHEIIDAFVDLFVQVLNKIRVCDTVYRTAKGILLCEVGKFTRNVCEQTVVPSALAGCWRKSDGRYVSSASIRILNPLSVSISPCSLSSAWTTSRSLLILTQMS